MISPENEEAYRRFSAGTLDANETIRRAGLHCYGELLDGLALRGLPIPRLPEDRLKQMAQTIVILLKEQDAIGRNIDERQ